MKLFNRKNKDEANPFGKFTAQDIEEEIRTADIELKELVAQVKAKKDQVADLFEKGIGKDDDEKIILKKKIERLNISITEFNRSIREKTEDIEVLEGYRDAMKTYQKTETQKESPRTVLDTIYNELSPEKLNAIVARSKARESIRREKKVAYRKNISSMRQDEDVEEEHEAHSYLDDMWKRAENEGVKSEAIREAIDRETSVKEDEASDNLEEN